MTWTMNEVSFSAHPLDLFCLFVRLFILTILSYCCAVTLSSAAAGILKSIIDKNRNGPHLVLNGDGIRWNSAITGISRHRNDYRLVGGLSQDPQEFRDLGVVV